MIKVWGRTTSSNVQKVMWAIGEIGLPHERIDIGGPFGKNDQPAYLAMNPNGLVPTLEEEDGFLLWESNSIVRYLAGKHKATVLEPADLRTRALASKWMDWQLSVMGPAITPVFWGMIRTPPEKRDHAAIDAGKKKTTAAVKMMDDQLAKTPYLCRRRILLRRYPCRDHVVSLSAACVRSSAFRQFRALVCRDLAAKGIQGPHRGGAADVAFVIPGRGARARNPESAPGLWIPDLPLRAIRNDDYSAAARAPLECADTM